MDAVDEYAERICDDFSFVKDLECNICFNSFAKDDYECVKLKDCSHYYHFNCIRKWFKQKQTCPNCNYVYGKVIGNQHEGTMDISYSSDKLPSFNCNTIVVHYNIPSGIQNENHPNPGVHFSGAIRTAFLPNNEEGNQILKLFRRAFEQKLIFTVGTSLTSGQQNTVTWNGIHHKTSYSGSYGYPDENYLNRVKDELKNKGLQI